MLSAVSQEIKFLNNTTGSFSMNPVRHLKLTVTVLFLIVLSVVNITSADQPVISSFTGETTPGITSQMALEWTYGGTLLIDLQFKL